MYIKRHAFLILVLIISLCSIVYGQRKNLPPILTDALTLELTFGSDNLPDEYLISYITWRNIAVSNNGDIFVGDEQRIKVFDKNGNPKKIIGRPGQGPNEFSFPPSSVEVIISPTGFMTAGDEPYNVYSPDNEYLKQKSILYSPSFIKIKEAFNLRLYDTLKVIMLSENQSLIHTHAMDYSSYPEGRRGPNFGKNSYQLLIHERDSTVKVLEQFDTNYVKDGAQRYSSLEMGLFNFAILSDNNVVYSHGFYDKKIDEKGSYYYLYIVSLDTYEKRTIQVPFEPVKFSIDFINRIGEFGDFKKYYENVQYYGAVRKIITDGDIIYAIIYHTDYKEPDDFTDYSVPLVANVINSKTGEHISTVLLPLFPAVIKDGYVYVACKNKDGSYQVEKYKIDPKVYLK